MSPPPTLTTVERSGLGSNGALECRDLTQEEQQRSVVQDAELANHAARFVARRRRGSSGGSGACGRGLRRGRQWSEVVPLGTIDKADKTVDLKLMITGFNFDGYSTVR